MFHFQYGESLSLDFYDYLYIVAFFFFLICLEVVVDFTSFYLGVLDLEQYERALQYPINLFAVH